MKDDRMAEAPIPEKISGDEALRRNMEAAVSPDAMPIDENAFLNSKSFSEGENLKKVNLPNSVEIIGTGTGTFSNYPSLEKIEIPEGVEEITIPEGVKDAEESEIEKSGPKM